MFIQQAPIGSPFGAASTAADVLAGIDLSGRTAIVTGGYSGIGIEAVRALAAAGARVTVPARDLGRAQASLAGIAGVRIATMDLMDAASIAAFADRFVAADPALDILINGAGVMANPLTRDALGYESQFSTNVLGHYRLTCALWPALVAAHGARVVAVTSNNHRVDVADLLRDPNFVHGAYDPWAAYARSKAANILFAVALDHLGRADGVRAFAAHPGAIIETGLARHMDMGIARAFGMIDEEGRAVIDPDKGWKTPAQGAATMVWAATSPLLHDRGGVYLSNAEVGVRLDADAGDLDPTGVTPGVIDPVNAGRLWQLCQQLTGATID